MMVVVVVVVVVVVWVCPCTLVMDIGLPFFSPTPQHQKI